MCVSNERAAAPVSRDTFFRAFLRRRTTPPASGMFQRKLLIFYYYNNCTSGHSAPLSTPQLVNTHTHKTLSYAPIKCKSKSASLFSLKSQSNWCMSALQISDVISLLVSRRVPFACSPRALYKSTMSTRSISD